MAKQAAALSLKPTPEKPQNVRGGLLQRQCACGNHATAGGGECEECKKKREQGLMQRAALNTAPVGEVPAIVYEVLNAPGQPLESGTRDYMERRFERDFSGVRVHSGAQAAESASAVNALAYTVGQNVVFGTAQYAPGSSDGRKLIAHELTHVVQQTRMSDPPAANGLRIAGQDTAEREAQQTGERITQGAFAGAVQPGGIALQRQPRTLNQVEVDQSTPQKVTLTYSDNTTESDECSSGKGHCCFDGSQAQGGACSAAGSQVADTNCTPVGTFTVTQKIPVTSGGVELWTQFHDSRSIALHKYSPVDGTPLSHGCVRLHEATARKIFNAAVPGRTRVRVVNLAQPQCDHPALQREWLGDFMTAGETPPDGERVDPITGTRRTAQDLQNMANTRREIATERKALRSALGVNDADLDAAIAEISKATSNFRDLTTPEAKQTLLKNIPRCLPAQTKEEARVPEATRAGVTAQPGELPAFRRALARSRNQSAARGIVQRLGEELWSQATSRAQSGTPDTDDRRLYWARLQLTQEIRQFDSAWLQRLDPDKTRRARQELLDTFERASRGMLSASFQGSQSGDKRIVISGFDPFNLNTSGGGNIGQGNPSGAAVLALDGQRIAAGGVNAQIQGVIFPVRYRDFDASILENVMRPYLNGPDQASLIMTISMGVSQDFELEEFAGRRRSTTFPENEGRSGGGTQAAPVAPPGLASGPEFIHTNVSKRTLGAMRGSLGRKNALPGETEVKEIRAGERQVRQSAAGPSSATSIAVEGSGGGFLSNEIFYRTSFLRTQSGANVPVIHLHTPFQGPNASEAQRAAMTASIRRILEAALPTL